MMVRIRHGEFASTECQVAFVGGVTRTAAQVSHHSVTYPVNCGGEKKIKERLFIGRILPPWPTRDMREKSVLWSHKIFELEAARTLAGYIVAARCMTNVR